MGRHTLLTSRLSGHLNSKKQPQQLNYLMEARPGKSTLFVIILIISHKFRI